MRRFLLLFILVALVAVAVGWFATDPGTVVLELRGWRIETSAGALALAVAVLVVACIVVWASFAWLAAAPARMRRWRTERRRRRGLKALAAGMVSVAAGDARGARRAARRAQLAESETPLTLLLNAQAAQLEGDDKAAEKFFHAMLARPETEFLALRGLLIQARNARQDDRALELAERAAKLRPDAGWTHQAVFDLAVREQQWRKAETALGQAVRHGAVGRDVGAQHRAALFLAEAAEAERKGFAVEALSLARRAQRADPDLVPAALARARFEVDQGSPRRARRILERAFARTPHPEIARAYLALAPASSENDNRERLRLAGRLLKAAPDAPEAFIAAAEEALAAKLWGRARKHVDDADARLDDQGRLVPARHFRLRAEIEEAECADAQAAALWLRRAAQAAPDPRWVCGACGETAPAWTPLCGRCHGFNTLAWRTPAPLAALGPRPEPGPGAGETVALPPASRRPAGDD